MTSRTVNRGEWLSITAESHHALIPDSVFQDCFGASRTVSTMTHEASLLQGAMPRVNRTMMTHAFCATKETCAETESRPPIIAIALRIVSARALGQVRFRMCSRSGTTRPTSTSASQTQVRGATMAARPTEVMPGDKIRQRASLLGATFFVAVYPRAPKPPGERALVRKTIALNHTPYDGEPLLMA